MPRRISKKDRDRGYPESGMKWLILGFVALGAIFTFNYFMLAELHGRFFDPIYPAKNYLYFLATPLFIKAGYLAIEGSIPPK